MTRTFTQHITALRERKEAEARAAGTCCPVADVRLVSEDGYECLNCGRCFGHHRPTAADFDAFSTPTQVDPVERMYAEAFAADVDTVDDDELQAAADILDAMAVNCDHCADDRADELRADSELWAEALRGGNELRATKVTPTLGTYEFFAAPRTNEPQKLELHPQHLNVWPEELERGMPVSWAK